VKLGVGAGLATLGLAGVGAGLATLGLAGVGAGIGIVFAALVNSFARTPSFFKASIIWIYYFRICTY